MSSMFVEDIITDFVIADLNVLSNYLMWIWKDMMKYSYCTQGMNRMMFGKYYLLPGLISQRLFEVFDTDQDNSLSLSEFIQGMVIVFSSQFDELINFSFAFYDFDRDGVITKTDVEIILEYIPLNKKYYSKKTLYEQNSYNDRLETKKEIKTLLDKAFGQSNTMEKSQYIEVVQKRCSDFFILLIMFLLEKKPFCAESLNVFMMNKAKAYRPLLTRTPEIGRHKIMTPEASKFATPMMKKRLSLQKEKMNALDKYIKEAKKKTAEKEPLPRKKIVGRIGNILKGIDTVSKKDSGSLLPKIIVEESNSASESTSDEGEQIELNYHSPVIQHEGYIFKVASTNSKLKQVYFKLIEKDLYYFTNKTDTIPKGVHRLCNVYVCYDKHLLTTLGNKRYYSFDLVYPQKIKKYFVEDQYEYTNWITKITESLNIRSVFDIYDIKKKIGNGKFGIVKVATHKKSKKDYAIKILSKASMTYEDLELTQTELDIMKICNHPNIIKLYDIFDSKDYIYIIMDYCKGNDLYTYLVNRKTTLSERRAKQIIYQICSAVNYLHAYGIVHRDLKLENILLCDESEESQIKIVDFGLSRFLLNGRQCNEPYGTLSYVAPEILMEEGYDFKVDMWAIGVITYLLMCGCFPFDDENEKEIIKKIIKEELKFSYRVIRSISSSCIDFMNKLLTKNPASRMDIKAALEHRWLKNIYN